jgi:PncC family amidohydrolase
MFDKNLKDKAKKIIALLQNNNLKISCAESCTGGLLSALLTDIENASKVFDRGFITYSNEAKIDLLAVKPQTLEKYGAVSKQTAQEMAIGVLEKSLAQISVAITGIAGPGGGSLEKPVGLVYIAFGEKNQDVVIKKYNFTGNRCEIRMACVASVLEYLEAILY